MERGAWACVQDVFLGPSLEYKGRSALVEKLHVSLKGHEGS